MLPPIFRRRELAKVARVRAGAVYGPHFRVEAEAQVVAVPKDLPLPLEPLVIDLQIVPGIKKTHH